MKNAILITLIALVPQCAAQIASMPIQRFKPWDESTIPVNLRQAIGWTTAGLWNKPTTMPNEEKAFLYIQRENPALATSITRVMSKEQWDCWINHYEDFWWVDLPEAARNAYTILGYDEFIWDTESFIPGPMTLIWDALLPTQQNAVKTLCYTKELWANLDLRVWVETKPLSQLPYPTKRYTEWKDLDVDTRSKALQAGYTPSSWNIPSFGFEKLHFRRLLNEFPNIANNVYDMGFKAPVWNCWINHYEDFFWREMPPSVQAALATLGYNQPVWDAGNSPPLPALQEWDFLTPVQQGAMKQLCYTREIWDEIDMRVWIEDLPLSEMVYPTVRYTPWNRLSPEIKQLAFQAGYSNATWDILDSHPHERRSMKLILEEYPVAFDAIIKMGIRPAEWNAFVTHYNAFYWNDLERFGKTSYLAAFNWTQDTWDNETIPAAWQQWWWQMPNNLKTAALNLGYEDITWDVRDLNQFVNYGYPTMQPSNSPSATPSLAPSGSPSSAPSLSMQPSGSPSAAPSDFPSLSPSATPSSRPSFSMSPSTTPSASPSDIPSASPSVSPSQNPTVSMAPTGVNWPSGAPSDFPSLAPSDFPSNMPSSMPSDAPSLTPTSFPSTQPILRPSAFEETGGADALRPGSSSPVVQTMFSFSVLAFIALVM